MRRLLHVITPGDHYSPRTGSAVPTVVHGLSVGMPQGSPRPAVAVASGTYPDRYSSADIVEYRPSSPLRLPGGLSERHVDGGLALLGLPRLAQRRTFKAVVRGQREWEPSVVVAHNAPTLVPLVDEKRHVPVLHAHNQLFGRYRPREARRVLRNARAIVCVSEALAQQTADLVGPRAADLIRVVRNGVEADLFARPAGLEETPELRVVFVGRVIPEKGPDVLVDAVRRLGRDDIHLTVVGSSGFSATDAPTPYETRLRESVASMGSRAAWRPFVPRDEVVEILHRADVVVVPSRWPDPCPLTVLEGAAAGACVIGSRIGGIPESLEGAGVLVDPGDSGDLAQAIEALADDRALLRSTTRRCVELARSHDWAWAARNLVRALDDVL